jgi:hypothetical protein
MRRERVGEVREAVEYEHGAVPRHRRSRRLRHRLCGFRSVALTHRIFLLCRSDAHLYGGIDERVERALNRRAIIAAAPACSSIVSVVSVVPVIVYFCGVQREDRA